MCNLHGAKVPVAETRHVTLSFASVCVCVVECVVLSFAVDWVERGGMPGPCGLVKLPVRCVGQVLYTPKKQSVWRSCHATHLRPRRPLNVRSAITLTKQQVHAEEGQLNKYRLTSVKKQAAEHRKRILSELNSSGILFVKVHVSGCLETAPAPRPHHTVSAG